MFIDQATIHVKAGNGGAGSRSFRREKFAPKGGPDGGDGGRGGSVILKVDENVQTLLDVKYQRFYRAKNGGKGLGTKKFGKSANDLVILVPSGTLVMNDETDDIVVDLVYQGQQFVAAKGGDGGRGNTHFSTPTNRAPHYAEPGWPGEERTLRLELKLIADVGLIGLPNAGKSTLLSRLSAARPKVGAYPFTTLEPMLGVVRVGNFKSFVAADIPGLIQGASQGKGLGHEFLRHVERTKILLHLVDVTTEDPVQDYYTIRKELETYSPELAKKPAYFIWTKADLLSDTWQAPDLQTQLDPISAVTGKGVQKLIYFLHNQLLSLQSIEKRGHINE
ncbi:MAG: GTPase ObgE [Candidatus Cloacimonetes bacterium 4572_55]|nr:MAG: GTPase ObgE [Candidatus Cloacimonetes bacterium 4572_55]